MLVLLMGGIYELHGLRCHDVLIKFHKGCFTYLKVARWSHEHTFIFQNKEIKLKTCGLNKILHGLSPRANYTD
jgi:hypothetical protein